MAKPISYTASSGSVGTSFSRRICSSTVMPNTVSQATRACIDTMGLCLCAPSAIAARICALSYVVTVFDLARNSSTLLTSLLSLTRKWRAMGPTTGALGLSYAAESTLRNISMRARRSPMKDSPTHAMCARNWYGSAMLSSVSSSANDLQKPTSPR